MVKKLVFAETTL